MSNVVSLDEFRARRDGIVIDEIQHWTKDNSALDDLMARILARSAEQVSDFRRAWLNHLSPPRSLPVTDQGSDHGDAESHQGDDRQPLR
jgi:hypothetical protein